jgi:hypothetical protein
MFGYWFLTIIGLITFVTGCHLQWKLHAVRSWPTTRGELEHKAVVPKQQAVPTDRGYHWEVTVRYRYAVNGEELFGERLFPYFRYFDRDGARRFVEQLPAQVTVRYNPRNAAEAFLFVGSRWWPNLAIGLGGVMGLLGALLLLAGG